MLLSDGETTMIVGVPTEVKTREYRVGMIPAGAHTLASRGHKVLVQAGAGLGSGDVTFSGSFSTERPR